MVQNCRFYKNYFLIGNVSRVFLVLSINSICLFQVVLKKKLCWNCQSVKSTVKISSIFVAFLENINFTTDRVATDYLTIPLINYLAAENKKVVIGKNGILFLPTGVFPDEFLYVQSLFGHFREPTWRSSWIFFFVVSEVWSIRWQPVAKCLWCISYWKNISSFANLYHFVFDS